jgi:hypothetical protein
MFAPAAALAVVTLGYHLLTTAVHERTRMVTA